MLFFSSGLQATTGCKQTYIWVSKTLTLRTRGHTTSVSLPARGRAMCSTWTWAASSPCGRSHSKEQLSWKCRGPGWVCKPHISTITVLRVRKHGHWAHTTFYFRKRVRRGKPFPEFLYQNEGSHSAGHVYIREAVMGGRWPRVSFCVCICVIFDVRKRVKSLPTPSLETQQTLEGWNLSWLCPQETGHPASTCRCNSLRQCLPLKLNHPRESETAYVLIRSPPSDSKYITCILK
jgi:hypothetical protein